MRKTPMLFLQYKEEVYLIEVSYKSVHKEIPNIGLDEYVYYVNIAEDKIDEVVERVIDQIKVDNNTKLGSAVVLFNAYIDEETGYLYYNPDRIPIGVESKE